MRKLDCMTLGVRERGTGGAWMGRAERDESFWTLPIRSNCDEMVHFL